VKIADSALHVQFPDGVPGRFIRVARGRPRASWSCATTIAAGDCIDARSIASQTGSRVAPT
jgi:hypothetical protein